MKWKQDRFRVSLDEITRSVHGKFNYITVNFDSIITKLLNKVKICLLHYLQLKNLNINFNADC